MFPRACRRQMEQEEQLEANDCRAVCPHCGKPIRLETTVEPAWEDSEAPKVPKTVAFADSNHPAIVAERLRRHSARR